MDLKPRGWGWDFIKQPVQCLAWSGPTIEGCYYCYSRESLRVRDWTESHRGEEERETGRNGHKGSWGVIVLPTGMFKGVTIKCFHGLSLGCRLLGKEERPQFTDEDISCACSWDLWYFTISITPCLKDHMLAFSFYCITPLVFFKYWGESTEFLEERVCVDTIRLEALRLWT